MGFDISREKLAALREKYPQGCRVELIKMDDPYREMPSGMHGTVTGVDDIGTVHVRWDNSCHLGAAYGEDRCRKLYGKEAVDALFEKIVGCRFRTCGEMEDWFREKLEDAVPHLEIRQCDSINWEVDNGITEIDYSTDCSFGEDIFGMDYADFTIDYIRDNEKRMYITYARWN